MGSLQNTGHQQLGVRGSTLHQGAEWVEATEVGLRPVLPASLCCPLLVPATYCGRTNKSVTGTICFPSGQTSFSAPPSTKPSEAASRASRGCSSLASDLVGTVQQGSVNVFGTGNLGFDDSQVLRVGQAVWLHCIWLCGCGYQCWRVLGAVTAL